MQQQISSQTIEAIFENGVFRPLAPINDSINEGQHVHLTIAMLESQNDPLEMLRNIYAGLSEAEIDEIERIMLDRSNWSRKSLDE